MPQYAQRIQGVTGEAIKAILKLMTTPGVISFGGGNPSSDSFPMDTIEALSAQVLKKYGPALLQYGNSEGFMPLRQAVVEHILPNKGVKAGVENVMVTTGSQQGEDLINTIFLDPGDTVLVESPTFLAQLQAYTVAGAKIVAVEMDEQGVRLDKLEEAMKAHHPKLFYCIPTFQNPTGRTLPTQRRKAIAELAAKYDVLVLEDDPYCDLRYRGTGEPSIKSFDKSGNVVLFNSFSKTISPGLRLGTITAEADIIKKCCIAKQCSDTHSDNLSQAIVAEYLAQGYMPGHLEAILPNYARRMDAMLSALKAYFPADCRYTEPEGGLFIWVRLPGRDTTALASIASEKYGTAYVPGEYFFLDSAAHKDCLRLNFSGTAFENIEIGMKRLGELFKKGE